MVDMNYGLSFLGETLYVFEITEFSQKYILINNMMF